MSDVVLCPNCGGQKTVSNPPYIAGDVNSWVCSSISMYPCPTCDGQGWIRVDDVPHHDFDCIKYIALSSMETAENLMDECAKRADRIKELEVALERTVSGEHAVDAEVERLRAKISDIEGREDLVITELEHRACAAEERLRAVEEMRDELLGDWELKRGAIARLNDEVMNLLTLVDVKDVRISDITSWRDVERKTCIRIERELIEIVNELTTENERLITYHASVRDTHQARVVEFTETCERYETDLALMDVILETINPLIKSGVYAKANSSAESRLLAIRMYGLCQAVVQYRRKHGTVG